MSEGNRDFEAKLPEVEGKDIFSKALRGVTRGIRNTLGLTPEPKAKVEPTVPSRQTPVPTSGK